MSHDWIAIDLRGREMQRVCVPRSLDIVERIPTDSGLPATHPRMHTSRSYFFDTAAFVIALIT